MSTASVIRRNISIFLRSMSLFLQNPWHIIARLWQAVDPDKRPRYSQWFLIWGFLIHSFFNQSRIYFRLSHKCNHSTLHCKSGFYQYGEHGKTYIFARLKWCISMGFFSIFDRKKTMIFTGLHNRHILASKMDGPSTCFSWFKGVSLNHNCVLFILKDGD